jgi:hypothetical protein
MKKVFLIPALLYTLCFASCDPLLKGTGPLITETRQATGFHALEVSTSGQTEVHTDSVFSVVVTCEESIMPYLKTEVENGVLKIFFNRPVWNVDGLHIRVGAPAWDGFDLSGNIHLNAPDAMAGQNLSLDISGSGQMNIANASFQNAKIDISGSGNVTIAGQGNQLNAEVSGSGDVNALGFPVKTATVDISGSGSINLNVSETLNAEVSGSGSVGYQGNPKVTSEVSGFGKVHKL